MATFINAQDSLGAFLAGQAATPQTAQLAAAERTADANLDTSLASLQMTITNRVDDDGQTRRTPPPTGPGSSSCGRSSSA